MSTSCPGPSPRSKWGSEKPLAKAAEILHESWSILSCDTWWNGFFGGCFQRLAALFVFCNRKPLFKQHKDISSCLCDEILTNFQSHFGSLGQGFLRPPIWTRRVPWGRGWSWCVTTQEKDTEQHIPVVLDIMPHKVALTFESWHEVATVY